jgi:ABC-2 type transport system permease protein
MPGLRRLLKIIKKEFIQLGRDRRLLPMVIIMPILQLFMFGYVVSTDIKHLPTVIYDQDRSQLSRDLGSRFGNAGYFDINIYAKSEHDIQEALDSGQALVAVNIPPGFSRTINGGRKAVIQVIVDGSDSSTSALALNYANQIIGMKSADIVAKRVRAMPQPASIRAPSLDSRLRIWYNPEQKSVNYMIPGLIALILMMSTMSLTSQGIVREKDQGTLEQLIVTPIRRSELVLGKILPYAAIGFLQIGLIFAAGIAIFHVPFRGSFIFLLFSCIVFLFISLGGGLFISTVSKTRQQAMLSSMFVMLPAMFLSGFIFPIENMPLLLQQVAKMIPLTYFLVIVRGVFLKGTGLQVMWVQMLILAGFAVLVFALSVIRFHKKLD